MMTKKTLSAARQKLASQISKREGKLSEVSIGDIREVLSVLAHLEAEWHTQPYVAYHRPLDVLGQSAAHKAEEILRKSKKAK